MNKLRVLTALMLLALLAPAFPSVSLAGDPQPECPDGTTLVAKFEFAGGSYVFEKPEGNEDVVTISDADATGGSWDSTVGISHVIVKGGRSDSTDEYDPLAYTGTFSNENLAPNPSGEPPDISNIQFCAPEGPPPTGTITIKKTVVGDPPGSEWEFSGSPDIGIFGLPAEGGEESFDDLPPGTYTFAETTKTGYVATAECKADDTVIATGDDSVTVELDPGEHVTCTFINDGTKDAITLASFTAKAGVGSVVLAWETGTELDNAGFNLYRATAPGGPYAKINAALIAAQGDPVAGASYAFLDQGLPPGIYFYELEDVDLNGAATRHGPVATIALPRFRRLPYRPAAPR